MGELPRPLTKDQQFLAAVCERLDTQNALLGEIRDRLSAPSERSASVSNADGAVGLSEPAASSAPGGARPVDGLDVGTRPGPEPTAGKSKAATRRRTREAS